jgi:hypothetical protein
MVAVVAGCCGSHMTKLWALICRMQNIANSRQQLIDEMQYVPILCYRTAEDAHGEMIPEYIFSDFHSVKMDSQCCH